MTKQFKLDLEFVIKDLSDNPMIKVKHALMKACETFGGLNKQAQMGKEYNDTIVNIGREAKAKDVLFVSKTEKDFLIIAVGSSALNGYIKTCLRDFIVTTQEIEMEEKKEVVDEEKKEKKDKKKKE